MTVAINPADHMGLIGKAIKKYRITPPDGDQDSLYQEGAIGLLMAARGYRPELGAFSTHAYTWIRSRLWKHYLRGSGQIGVGPNVSQLHRNARRDGHADGLGKTDKRRVAAVAALYGRKKVSFQGQDDPIDDPSIARQDGGFGRVDDADQLGRLASTAGLSDREWRAVRLHWGLDGNGGMSFSEIGKAMGVTRQAAQQCHANAMRLLKEAGAEGGGS